MADAGRNESMTASSTAAVEEGAFSPPSPPDCPTEGTPLALMAQNTPHLACDDLIFSVVVMLRLKEHPVLL